MTQKISIGIIVGTLIGMFTTSFFLSVDILLKELFLTKITATSIITGFLVGIYASLSKSKFKLFLISIAIGIFTFYMKFLLTGHNFEPVTMGAFTGALLGGAFIFIRKLKSSFRRYKRLKKLRRRGFNNYS